MKYALTWTTRLGGSGKDNEEAVRRGLVVFSKWEPAAGTTFHQFVARLDQQGGYAIVETDNPVELLTETAKFAPFNEFHIHPVVDMDEWAQAIQGGIDFRSSIG
jgi:Protein of unknown function (DUF3303)